MANNGSYVTEKTEIPLIKCKKSFFNTEFMRDAFDLYDVQDMYCIDQDDERFALEGTKND